MNYKAFPVYDLRTGLDLSVEPWKAPGDAYTKMNDAYLRRGRLYKRDGQSIFGQLGKRAIATIDANPSDQAQTGTLSNTPVIPYSIIITAAGKTIRDDGLGALTGDVDSGETNTINYATGAYAFTFDSAPGAVDTDVEYHYEIAEDCRGIFLFDRYKATNELLGFQKKRMSKWDETNKFFVNVADSGSAYDHFNSTGLVSTTSFNDILWIVTNEATDGIWTYNGTIVTDETTAGTLDTNAAGSTDIKTCLHIFPHKGRMLMLNTVDGSGAGTRNPQRLRWSWVGNPQTAGAWQDDVAGKGGFVDCPTNYEILDYGFVGDTPVVFFEKGVWAIDYTGDPVLPFTWRKVSLTHQNSATHSKIEYDKFATAVGGKGLVASNASSAFTYNDKIPDFTYTIDLDNIQFCYGIRDDRYDLGMTSYPEAPSSTPNNRILVYNYEDNSYSKFRLNSKCFGEWTTAVDPTFASFGVTTFDDLPNLNWGESSLQAGFPFILSGWTNGYVYKINDESTGLDTNSWAEKLGTGGSAPVAFNFDCRSIRINPFIKDGRQATLGRIDFLVDKNSSAEFTVDFFSDMHDYAYLTKTVDCDATTPERKVWKSIEINHTSNFHSFRTYLSAAQVADGTKKKQQIIINAVVFWMEEGEEIL